MKDDGAIQVQYPKKGKSGYVYFRDKPFRKDKKGNLIPGSIRAIIQYEEIFHEKCALSTVVRQNGAEKTLLKRDSRFGSTIIYASVVRSCRWDDHDLKRAKSILAQRLKQARLATTKPRHPKLRQIYYKQYEGAIRNSNPIIRQFIAQKVCMIGYEDTFDELKTFTDKLQKNICMAPNADSAAAEKFQSVKFFSGSAGFETAAITIGQIAVSAVKEAVETGEIALQNPEFKEFIGE